MNLEGGGALKGVVGWVVSPELRHIPLLSLIFLKTTSERERMEGIYGTRLTNGCGHFKFDKKIHLLSSYSSRRWELWSSVEKERERGSEGWAEGDPNDGSYVWKRRRGRTRVEWVMVAWKVWQCKGWERKRKKINFF